MKPPLQSRRCQPRRRFRSNSNVVAIHLIHANPLQPRKLFSEEALHELMLSIKEHGVIQPILVAHKTDGTYEIIAGERRWRAAQRAGLTELPVVLKSGTENQKFAMALIENIQRADLNGIELAKGYQRLRDEFEMTQEAIAKAVGKDRAVVANALRLLALAPEIQTAVEEGKISSAHARTLAGLEDAAAQKDLFQKIISEQLSVRAVEEAVRAKKSVKVREHVRLNGYDVKAPEVRTIEEDLQQVLTRKVELHETNSTSHKGWLKLEFYSLDDLEALITRLKKIRPEIFLLAPGTASHSLHAEAQRRDTGYPVFLASRSNPNEYSVFANNGWDGNWYVGYDTAWIQKLPPLPGGNYARAFVGAKLGRMKTLPPAGRPPVFNPIPDRIVDKALILLHNRPGGPTIACGLRPPRIFRWMEARNTLWKIRGKPNGSGWKFPRTGLMQRGRTIWPYGRRRRN